MAETINNHNFPIDINDHFANAAAILNAGLGLNKFCSGITNNFKPPGIIEKR